MVGVCQPGTLPEDSDARRRTESNSTVSAGYRRSAPHMALRSFRSIASELISQVLKTVSRSAVAVCSAMFHDPRGALLHFAFVAARALPARETEGLGEVAAAGHGVGVLAGLAQQVGQVGRAGLLGDAGHLLRLQPVVRADGGDGLGPRLTVFVESPIRLEGRCLNGIVREHFEFELGHVPPWVLSAGVKYFGSAHN